MKRKHGYFLLIYALIISMPTKAQIIVTEKNGTGNFSFTGMQPISIYTDKNDDWLVHKTVALLQHDIEMVTGKRPDTISSISSSTKNVIVIGTLAGCDLIHQLITNKKLSVDSTQGKWEAFSLQTLQQPVKGVDNALMIIGSDKRGAAYGAFELSRQIGVSPWYWWADVPVIKRTELYVKNGVYNYASPSVKYRGIFINDEAPAFSGWTKEKFGGVNHLVYEKVFELLLRLKANYLWPAMWGNAFNDEYTLNPDLADKWGIVMGTSHHEPMLRAQQEWKRYGKGAWDYTKNDSVLRAFWRKGIENMGSHESLVTIGMRGDGDEPMTKGTAISLLEKIVADQRKIIEDVTKKPASQTPQVWALYKEVQDYYDQGMRVPDDVTLLLSDDNWGNLRRLPKLKEKPRAGGYGIYYHFDYVGGPRNYKWINTNNIARVWEQMHLAYEYNAKQVWIVNVGDLKPMEFPISFFLDYAWNVNRWNEDNLNEYYTKWSAEQFGNTYAKEIGNIIQKYSEYSARRKPELLDANTYSLNNDNEAQRVTNDWKALLQQAQSINNKLPIDYKDAYFQLVLHPVKACANLQQLYTAVALNHQLAKEHNALANRYADSAKRYYVNDSLITIEYNELNGGKWNHMMDQKHIGYTYWQEPPQQKMPDVMYVSPDSAIIKTVIANASVKTAGSLIPRGSKGNVFYEQNGYVSIEAAHYTSKKESGSIKWKVIPNIGREGDGITTFPVTEPSQLFTTNAPSLTYNFYSYDADSLQLNALFSPTLNFSGDSTGLQYAVSIDEEQPQIISINKDDTDGRKWNSWVANNIIIKTTHHFIQKTGRHTVRYYALSPAVILQKLVIDFGDDKKSYLGPQETIAQVKQMIP